MMNGMISSPLHASGSLPLSPSQRKAELDVEQAKVLIRGDLRIYVTEAEVALGPITGRYTLLPIGMQEPLYPLWHGEGHVRLRYARSTMIDFDLRGARAGECRTFLVSSQVIEQGAWGRAVQSAVFVQIFVMAD